MNRKEGLISVILPTYNRCSFLEDVIFDIKGQTYTNWELIIVNDGSTDNTKDYLDSLSMDNLKVIHLEENSSTVSVPRNIGISHADGEFIAPTDDDNGTSPVKFEYLVSALNKNPDAILAYGDRTEVRGESVVHVPSVPHWDASTHGVDNSQILYRAAVYDHVPLIFPLNACDWYTAKHIRHLGNFVYVPIVVGCYRVHEGNRNTVRKFRKVDIEKYRKYFCDKHEYKLSEKEFFIE